MKILITVLGDASGGRWKVFLDYAEVLRDSGHDILLLLNSKNVSTDVVVPADIALKFIRNSGHYDLLATLSAMRVIKRFQPDVVICHCGRSVTLMKRAAPRNVPVIAVNHSNNVKRSVRADAYFNISNHIGRLIKNYPNAKGKGYHIPNMVEMPQVPEWSPHAWHHPVRIGAFGRFDAVKGFHLFIEALGILKKRGVVFKAQLGGDGVQKNELLNLISEYNLEQDVTLTGWVRDTQQFFHQTDIFCVPALSDAFGITPLEAAIAGMPIVATDAEGHQDMFTNGQHAILVPRGNAEAMASALEEMLSNPTKAESLSKNAFDRVTSTYNRANFSKKLNQALCDIVSV